MRQGRLPAAREHLCLRFLVLCLVAVPFVTSTTTAEAQIRPALLLQPSPAEQPFTAELVETRRKEVAESTDLSDDAKQQADDHYKFVDEALQRIQELTMAAAQFAQDTDNVQERSNQLRIRLRALQDLKPSPPTVDTLPELEQEQTQRNVQLAELKAALLRVESVPTTRANRLKEIRALLLSASQRITDINRQLAIPPPEDEPKLLTAGRLSELRTRLQLIEAELPALQNELAKYDAEDAADFVRLERDVRTRDVLLAEAELKLFEELIDRLRAEANAEALERARDEAIAAQPLLREAAELNATLAEKAVGLTAPIDQAKSQLEDTQGRLEGIVKQFAITEQRVSSIGLTGAVGSLLRRQKSELSNPSEQRESVRKRRAVIEQAQYELFDYDDQRRDLADREAFVEQILKSAPADMVEADRQKLEADAQRVLELRANYLDQLIRSYNTWLDTLFELDETEHRLIAEAEKYTTYIDERVLWIRSNDDLFAKIELDESDSWLLTPGRWTEPGELLLADMLANLLLYAFVIAAVLTLLVLKPRICRALAAAGTLAERGNCTSTKPTLDAAMLTVLLSLLWPGVVWFLAARLSSISIEKDADFSGALAIGLQAVAWGYLPLEALLKICRRDGLADHHFDWSESTISLLRRTLPGLTACTLPLTFITVTLYASDPEHGRDFVERACFVATTIVLALFLRRAMRPDTGILRDYLAAHPEGWVARVRSLWYWGTVLSPLCLAGLTIAGFYYTAQQLAWRLFATILLVLSLQLIRALLQRLLIVQRRKLTIELARKQRKEQAAREAAGEKSAESGGDATGPTAVVPLNELRDDVRRNTEQSRRLLSMSLTVASLVGVWVIWFDVLPALHILDQWPLWTTRVEVAADQSSLAAASGTMPGLPDAGTSASPSPHETVVVVRAVTPRDVGLAILFAVITFACARNIPGLMEMWILQRLPLDQSVRYAITTLTSYAIVLLGVIVSFNSIYVGWSKVQWLATALTFGLAFGLQEIFANFVAGLILLFERPIRIGDVVTVDDVSGVVSRIRIRATTITTWDRKEYVIPNKEFIIGRMLNWTLTDKVNRIVINVGIAYGSDVDRAKELLLNVCRQHPLILTEPGSSVTFEGFGENTLDLVLRTYLPDLDNRLGVIDALHTSIDQAFRQSGIEIAFPQRDLHLRSIDDSAARKLRGPSESGPTAGAA